MLISTAEIASLMLKKNSATGLLGISIYTRKVTVGDDQAEPLEGGQMYQKS